MKKLIPATYRRTLGIWTPIAVPYFSFYFFFFFLSCQLLPVLNYWFHQKKHLIVPRNQQISNSVNSNVLLYFSVHFILFIIISSHTEFSLLSSFFLLCYFHSCYLYFLPSVVWVFAPISDPSSINFEFPVLLSRLLFFQPCKNPWLQWKCVAAESLLRSLICLLSLCWTSPSLLLDWS